MKPATLVVRSEFVRAIQANYRRYPKGYPRFFRAMGGDFWMAG